MALPIVALLAIGSSGCETGTNAAASSSASGGGGNTESACPAGFVRWTLPGVREDLGRQCVDVTLEEILFVDVCRPLDEGQYHPQSFFYCMQRLSDGKRYWVNPIFWLVTPIPGEWDFCDGEPILDELPPRPCFTDMCPEAPTGHQTPASTCAESAIRATYDCGGEESQWDAGCCRRPFCGSTDDCPDGLECREVQDFSPRGYCWVRFDPDVDPENVDLNSFPEGCSCTGDFADGPLPRVCIEPR